jgi:Zn-dependent protease with chaperone function
MLRKVICGTPIGPFVLRSLEANLRPIDPQDLTLLLPVGALLVPIVLTRYIVRKAEQVSDADRVVVWFSCVRFLRWLVTGTLLAWWVTTDVADWKPRFHFFLQAHELLSMPGAKFLALLFFWLPPILAVVLCQTLFQPVYSGVRGIDWTRAELARQMVYSLGASFLPLLLVTYGLTGIFSNQTAPGFVFSLFLAFACAIFFGRRLRKLLQLSPNALTTGELRDRVFFLASRLRVKLQQVYLLPPSRSRMANAFARSGRSILLTHYLLSHLTRREVDAVVAHELAHVKHDHPRLLGFALMGGFAAVAVPYFSYPWPPVWKPLFDVMFVAIPLLAYYFIARRFEFVADATSVRATGDPEAMITSLVKLHRLNLLPLQWSKWNEKLLTHPSTVRRAEAIARVAQLPDTYIAQLLERSVQPSSPQSAGAENDVTEYYPLPSLERLRQKVFSTEWKQARSGRSFLLSFMLMVLLPALLLRALDSLGFIGSPFIAFLAVLVLCVSAFLLLLDVLPFLGSARLQRSMLARAKSDAVVPADVLSRGEALLVGLSPGPGPRIFEGNYSWDAGYLYFSGDRLCYCGEETRFSLRRDQIAALQIGPGMPGWFRPKSLYIVWREAESSSSAIFNIRPLEVRSVLAMNREVRRLSDQIESWRTASPATTGEVASDSAESNTLSTPNVRAVTGTAIADVVKPQQLFSLMVITAFFAGMFASFLGLPFEGIFPVFGYDADAAAAPAGVSGCYAVLCTAVLFLVFVIPSLRARNAAVSLPAPAPVDPPPPPPVSV